VLKNRKAFVQELSRLLQDVIYLKLTVFDFVNRVFELAIIACWSPVLLPPLSLLHQIYLSVELMFRSLVVLLNDLPVTIARAIGRASSHV